MGTFIWSQSAVKDLEREETCPFRWHAQWVDRTLPSISNEDMDRGKYFEQILLGKSANEKEIISDLTRLDNGSKSTDQIRLEAQAERGKRILFEPSDPEYLGFHVVSTQVPLSHEDRSGVADIVAYGKNDELWIIDVKLTKDLTNERSIYGWGNIGSGTMDLMQFTHYKDLYEEMMGGQVKMGVLIFDYSTAKRVKFVEITISKERQEEKNTRFEAAKKVMVAYQNSKNGFVKTPSEKECERCSLVCSKRKHKSPIMMETVKY